MILAVAGVGVAALGVDISASAAEQDLVDAKALAEVKKTDAEVYTQLEEDIKDALNRMDTIKSIAQSKINWAKKLDELTDLILADDMWIHELELLQGSGKPAQGGAYQDFGTLKIQCFFSGTSMAPVNTFYQNLKNHRSFFSIFRDAGQPSATRRDIEDVYHKEFVEDQKWDVQSTFELHLAPRRIKEVKNVKDKDAKQ